MDYTDPNDPNELLRQRLRDLMTVRGGQPAQPGQPMAAPGRDLVSERLAQRPPTSIAPTDPGALDRVDLPGVSQIPTQNLRQAPPMSSPVESAGPSPMPADAGATGMSARTNVNAPYPFTPRPEYKDTHEHGKPIGLGQRILHSLKSAGMGFMRGGVGGAIAGGIGGAVDPNFYHRAQHYYKDLPLWQQRQQDEIEQAKTQQGLNESNARIENVGIDNELARQRAEEEKRHHGALETAAAQRAAKVTEKPPVFDASRKAMWDAKSGKWIKAPGAENIPEKDMTPAERAHLKLAEDRLAWEKSKGLDSETENIFGYPEGSMTPAQYDQEKQKALTHIDSIVERKEVDRDEGEKMKLSWVNQNPPPKPVHIGTRKARTAGGASPSGGQQGADHTGYAVGQTVEHGGKKYTYKGINPQTGKMRLVPAE